MAIDWQSKGIDLSRFSGRTSGHVKVHCPQCRDRRKNKADKSLSCDLATGAYRCHYCGWHGYAIVTSEEEKEEWLRQQPWYRDHSRRKEQTPKQEYARPPPDSLRPHELQHARPPCPSPTPKVHSASRPSSQ